MHLSVHCPYTLSLFNYGLCLYLYASTIELDMEGTISPESDPPQEMGDSSKEVTEDMRDKAQEERAQGSMKMAEGEGTILWWAICYHGMLVFASGDVEKAIEHFTAAVLANPKSAPLYAKRAR